MKENSMINRTMDVLSDKKWHSADGIIVKLSKLVDARDAVNNYVNWHRTRARKGDDDIEVQVSMGQRIVILRILLGLKRKELVERRGGRSSNSEYRLL
jgi:hypothetical protein